jgi:hypothetical protein
VRPSRHLELRNDFSRSQLDIDDPVAGKGRLFTAYVARVRGTYAFDARSFLRLIGQYTRTTQGPPLFAEEGKAARFNGTGLFAYKLNWQTVFYLGYGDERTFDAPTNRMQKSGRQLFAKLSYAWQR